MLGFSKSTKYRCDRKGVNGNPDCLEGVINASAITDVIITAVRKFIEICSEQNAQKAKVDTTASIELLQAIQETKLRIKEVSANKTAFYDRYCDGDITREEYIRLRDMEDTLLCEAEKEFTQLERRKSESQQHIT